MGNGKETGNYYFGVLMTQEPMESADSLLKGRDGPQINPTHRVSLYIPVE